MPTGYALIPPRLSLRALQSPIAGPCTLDLQAGECLAIMGASGAGKSVLLRLIADLDPGSGQVLLNGQPRSQFSGPAWRQQVMYLAAEPAWWAESVMAHFPPDSQAQLLQLAAQLGLRHGFIDIPVAQLSTGERQRLALLRGLVRKPQVLLLDEPTAALDEDSILAVEQLLRSHQQQGLSVVWVTHSHPQASRVASRCLRLHERQLTPMETVQ
ncbi:ABC transporter ATP-binding protein [Comamonas odontotermitis]|uniref:ABC transporter ATP-binding protein n=1 Tax=Comamonas odontotermitis TaxID=379895 RepID=UPI001CC51F39|nr:ATP-binding cassette domain-containing protein [Comamonas odontotermitis]UBB17218.1 ATP-binding cassette domain-containing protein [Comamonas odontotermitis]